MQAASKVLVEVRSREIASKREVPEQDTEERREEKIHSLAVEVDLPSDGEYVR